MDKETRHVQVINPVDSVLLAQEPRALRDTFTQYAPEPWQTHVLTPNQEPQKLEALEQLDQCVLKLQPNKCIIAGGALVSVYTNGKIQDLDYYVLATPQEEERLLRRVDVMWEKFYRSSPYKHDTTYEVGNGVRSVYKFKSRVMQFPDINIMITEDRPELVVSRFDFTACQIYTDGGGRVDVSSPQTLLDLNTKTIRISNINSIKPRRIRKYLNKGFLPTEELNNAIEDIEKMSSLNPLQSGMLLEFAHLAQLIRKARGVDLDYFSKLKFNPIGSYISQQQNAINKRLAAKQMATQNHIWNSNPQSSASPTQAPQSPVQQGSAYIWNDQLKQLLEKKKK